MTNLAQGDSRGAPQYQDNPGVIPTLDAVLAYATKTSGPLPGVRLLMITAAASGLRLAIEKMTQPASIIAEEPEVAELARQIGVLLAKHRHCALAEQMAAGMPHNDLVTFLRICVQLQASPTLVPISESDEAFDDDDAAAGNVRDSLVLQRQTEDYIVASIPDDATAPPEASLEEFDLRRQISEVLVRLRPREERLLRMRFGIGGIGEHTLEQVGQSFGVTRERIRQLETRALVALALPVWQRGLQSYLFHSRISNTAKVGSPKGYLRDAIEAAEKRLTQEEAIERDEIARNVATRERARATELATRASRGQADVKRFAATEKIALRTYVASQNLVRKAMQVEAAANAAVKDFIKNASVTPGGAINHDRLEAEKAWALIKRADSENKVAAAVAAHESYCAAQRATQEAIEIARTAEADAAKAVAIAESAEQVAVKLTEETRRAKKAVAIVSEEWCEWIAGFQAKLAARRAERDAKLAAKQAERLAKTAVKQAKREAKEKTKLAERQAKAAAIEVARWKEKAAAHRAKSESERAVRKAKADVKQTDRKVKTASRLAKRGAGAAAEVAKHKLRDATKQGERNAIGTTRKAGPQVESTVIARMSLTEFTRMAVVQRHTAVQLVKMHRLRKVSSSDNWLDRRSATKFIQRFVSVEEIRRFPNGKETELILNLAKVPPALLLPKSGTAFYRRTYVMRVSAALS